MGRKWLQKAFARKGRPLRVGAAASLHEPLQRAQVVFCVAFMSAGGCLLPCVCCLLCAGPVGLCCLCLPIFLATLPARNFRALPSLLHQRRPIRLT